VYRSGDLARRLANGDLLYLGRIDHQVKIRGFRIELGEIEAALAQCPGVAQCAVLAREDRPADKRLVAYVVPQADTELSAAALRTALQERLPDYMVPVAFVTLPGLPLTPNGKVDRQALPPPNDTSAISNASCSEDRTLTEAQLILIWQDLLSTNSIGIDDNFFDIGGHSLLGARLLSRVEQSFDKRLPLQSLFLSPTIRTMARLLDTDEEHRKWSTLIPIQPNGSNPPLFCVAPPNANALGFAFLARRLGTEQPVFALQHQDVTNPERFYSARQYEEVAAEYIVAIRRIQPDGPYLLCGFCEGCHIAFDMARQLSAAGSTVGLLAMFDAWALENTGSYFRYWLKKMAERCVQLFTDGHITNSPVYLRRQFGRLKRYVLSKCTVQTNKTLITNSPPPSQMARWVERMWPGKHFVPPVFDGLITVCRTKSQPFWRHRDESLGWGVRAARGVEVIDIGGTHVTMLREPHVEQLAATLTDCLRRAQQSPHRPADHGPFPLECSTTAKG
jgi:thioesterase domain-containing protein